MPPSASSTDSQSSQPPAWWTQHARLLCEQMAHYNGRVREQALRDVTAQYVGSTDIWLAVLDRLNDWVIPVRAAAQKALSELLPALDMDMALAVQPAIARLQQGQRDDHAATIARIRQQLHQHITALPDAQRQSQCQRLMRLVRQSAGQQAWFCFDLLLHWATQQPASTQEQEQAQGLAAVLSCGLATLHAPTSRRALQCVRQLPNTLQPPLYEQALRSPFVQTRRAALRALSQWAQSTTAITPNSPWPAWLQAALQDANSSVRYLAIALCGGASQPRLLSHAQALLQSPTATPGQRAAALRLLADLGQPAARPWVLAALADQTVMVRCAAYDAAYRLQAHDADALTLAALQDPSARVFRVALLHAQRNGTIPGFDLLMPHLHNTQHPYAIPVHTPTRGDTAQGITHAGTSQTSASSLSHSPSSQDDAEHWRRLLQLTALGNTYNQLIVLLSIPAAALAHPHCRPVQTIGKLAQQWLRHAHRHTFAQPTPAQCQHIHALLPHAALKALFSPAQRRTFHALIPPLHQ